MAWSEIIEGKVYVVTNLITGEQYVGSTVTSIKQRWSSHKMGAKTGKGLLDAAIMKYGSHNFSVKQIDEAIIKRDLNQKETDWIDKLNTLAPNGYNRARLCWNNGNKTEEVKISMAKYKRDSSKSRKGCKHSEIAKLKIRDSATARKPKGMYKGVTKTKSGKYQACFVKSGELITIGYYDLDVEAAYWYDQAILENFGNDGHYLNFPELVEQSKCEQLLLF